MIAQLDLFGAPTPQAATPPQGEVPRAPEPLAAELDVDIQAPPSSEPAPPSDAASLSSCGEGFVEHEEPAAIAAALMVDLGEAKAIASQMTRDACSWMPDGGIDGEGPAGIAAEIAVELARAQAEIAGLALELHRDPEQDDGDGGSSLFDDLKRVLTEQCERADEDIQRLRGIHARILGCSVEELDARVAAESAKRKADAAEAKASRRPPAPTTAEGEAADPPKPKRGRPAKASTAPTTEAAATSQLSDRQCELLRIVKVDGQWARFGSEERIDDWPALKVVLVALGGAWRRKPQAFLFPDTIDVAEKVETAIATGQIMDPRAAGFFWTSRPLAENLVTLARIEPGDRVLEPSAGQGALLDVIRERHPNTALWVYELLSANREVLEQKGYRIEGLNFLEAPIQVVDAVVANPPFSRGADVDHVTRMVEWLRPGGRLAAIMSGGVDFRMDARTTAFRALVHRHGGTIVENPPGSFLAAGTGIHTVTVSLTKRGE